VGGKISVAIGITPFYGGCSVAIWRDSDANVAQLDAMSLGESQVGRIGKRSMDSLKMWFATSNNPTPTSLSIHLHFCGSLS